MAGIKIINVLKDDSFPEILELFRQATATEVIFVLPKKSTVFRREDHFAAFASESATSGKSISILCSSPEVNELARKYKFSVMSAGKSTPQPKAVLTSTVPPADADIQNYNEDAYQDDVPMTSDETMNIKGQDDTGDEADPLHNMHIEDGEGPIDKDEDGNLDEPSEDDLEVAGDFIAAPRATIHAELAAAVDGVKITAARKNVNVAGKTEKPANVPVEHSISDLDYIDAVWREKAAQVVMPQEKQTLIPTRPEPWYKLGFLSKLNFKLPAISSSGFSKKLVAGILIASIIILAGITYAIAGQANVYIKPVTDPVDTQISVQASDVFSVVDADFGKIPGQLFQIAKTITATVPATGRRDVASKARGHITIYNELSSAPQPLVATTRFESEDGLVFRTLQSVTVPGSSVKDGKVVPGTVDVDVIADKPGSQYNIAAGKFGIAAFKERGDTDRYTKIYGKSTNAFAGGANGPSKVVTQADYDGAKNAAITEAKSQIAAAFKAQSSGLIILDGVEPTISDIKGTANTDDAADSLSLTVTATLKTIAIRQSDLFQLIKDSISRKDRLDVFPDKMDIKYTDIAYKNDIGALTFTAHVVGNGYAPIDVQSIIGDIKGKDANGFREYFKGKDGIESASVSMSPFWVSKIPQKNDRVHVQVDYGK